MLTVDILFCAFFFFFLCSLFSSNFVNSMFTFYQDLKSPNRYTIDKKKNGKCQNEKNNNHHSSFLLSYHTYTHTYIHTYTYTCKCQRIQQWNSRHTKQRQKKNNNYYHWRKKIASSCVPSVAEHDLTKIRGYIKGITLKSGYFLNYASFNAKTATISAITNIISMMISYLHVFLDACLNSL